MKRRVAFMLLISHVFLCAAAQAAIPVPDKSGKAANIRAAAAAGGTLYMLGYDMNLFRLNEEKNTVEELPLINRNPEYESVTPEQAKEKNILRGVGDPDDIREAASGVNLLAASGEDLYALNFETGALYAVEPAARQATMSGLCWLDYTFEDPTENGPYIHKAAVLNGQLYALMDRNKESYSTLYRFDMHTGARSAPLASDISDISPYRDGQLLLLKVHNLYGEGSVLALNPETGEEQALDTRIANGILDILYDHVLDRVILFVGNEIVALLEDGSKSVVGYWPQQNYVRLFSILPSGKLAIVYKGVELMDISAAAPVRRELKVAVSNLGIDEFRFVSEHPQILFDHRTIYPHQVQELFATQMTIASPEYDVLELPLGPVLDNAVEKGYFIPLDATEQLKERMGKLYPFIAQKLTSGETIAALPVSINNQTPAYSRYAASRLGITEAELPKTYGEFIAFCLGFDETYGLKAHEEGITLFAISPSSASNALMDQLIGGYCALVQADEEAALGKEAELGALLEGVKQLRSLPPGAPITGRPYEPPVLNGHNPPRRYRVNATPDYLFTLTATVLPGGRHMAGHELVNDFTPIPLRLFEGMKPQLLFTGSALVINPYSLNAQDAQIFLDYYARNFPVEDGAGLFTDAQPVPERDYNMLKKMHTKEIEELNKRRGAVEDEAEKRNIDSLIQASEAGLKTLDALKWAVSGEWLAGYRRYLEESETSWVDHSLYETSLEGLLNRFFGGSMDGGTCARELGGILTKVIEENR